MVFDQALKLNEADITLVCGSMKQLNILKSVYEKTNKKPHVHIAIDTGMGRFGFFWSKIPDLSEINNYICVDGCYTHLPVSRSIMSRTLKYRLINLRLP